MSDKKESSSLNANAAEFVPFAVQQSQWSHQHVAQRVTRGQNRPSFTRADGLHHAHTPNLPADTRPGTDRYQITNNNHHQDSLAPSEVLRNLGTASAHLLSIRYGFDPNDLTQSAAQLPGPSRGNSVLPRPTERAKSYSFSGLSTGARSRKRNQHKAPDVPRATGLPKHAAETFSTYMQGPSDDENNYKDGPDEAIRTRTSYIGPQMPKKYSFVDEMMSDENNEIPWEDKPLPPPFTYQKRFLPPKPSTQSRIPLYSALAGMQYDHNSKLYYGDGPPRRTPFRPDATGPYTPDRSRETQGDSISVDTSKLPGDILHLQPEMEVRENLLAFGLHGIATMRLCRCVNMWGPESAMTEHVCTEPGIEYRVQATPMSTKKPRFLDIFPDLDPVTQRGERELAQAERQMRPANDNGVASRAGNGHITDPRIRDLSEERVFTGPIARDFGAKARGEAVATRFLSDT